MVKDELSYLRKKLFFAGRYSIRTLWDYIITWDNYNVHIRTISILGVVGVGKVICYIGFLVKMISLLVP